MRIKSPTTEELDNYFYQAYERMGKNAERLSKSLERLLLNTVSSRSTSNAFPNSSDYWLNNPVGGF